MERPPSRHLSAVGDNSRLSDDQADRDADRDRGQQTKDDEDDETEHRRRVAFPVVSFVLPTVALGRPQRDAVHEFRRPRRTSCRALRLALERVEDDGFPRPSATRGRTRNLLGVVDRASAWFPGPDAGHVVGAHTTPGAWAVSRSAGRRVTNDFPDSRHDVVVEVALPLLLCLPDVDDAKDTSLVVESGEMDRSPSGAGWFSVRRSFTAS